MRLKSYVNHEIRLAMAAVVSVLMLIFTSQQFVRFLGDTVEGKISAEILFFMVALQIPPLLGFLLPLGLFLGILLAFGRMYVDHELVVAHSIGVGDRRLAAMILPSVVVIALLAGVFSLWIAPWAANQQQEALKRQDGKSELQLLTPGKFQVSRDGSSVMYIAESKNNAVAENDSGKFGEPVSAENLRHEVAMQQVFFAQLPQFEDSDATTDNANQEADANTHISAIEPEPQVVRGMSNTPKWRIITAQKGIQSSILSEVPAESETLPVLTLVDGASYTIPLHSKAWETTSFAEYSMKINQSSSGVRKLKVKSVSTLELFDNLTAEYWAEIHWRLSVPISIPLLALLAVPLARVEPRQGKFAKMLPALAMYMTYILLILGARGMIEGEKIPGFLGMWWVHGLMVGYLWYLYRPVRKSKVTESSFVLSTTSKGKNSEKSRSK